MVESSNGVLDAPVNSVYMRGNEFLGKVTLLLKNKKNAGWTKRHL